MPTSLCLCSVCVWSGSGEVVNVIQVWVVGAVIIEGAVDEVIGVAKTVRDDVMVGQEEYQG